jgi:lysophospholipase L1-like esterase
VIVSAIGGENAEQGSARFAADVLPMRPNVVTIDYALNDRWIGLDRARVAWAKIIEQALGTGAKVILLTPTADIAARFDAPDEPLNQHAAQIRELASHYGVGLCDSWEATKRAVAQGVPLASLMSQENHPNRAGHEIVARELVNWFV